MVLDVVLPFLTVGIAELGDKTQFILLYLGAKTRDHRALFAGVSLAFALSTALAVLIGRQIATYFSFLPISAIVGVFFLVAGLWGLFHRDSGNEAVRELPNPFLSGFTLIFLSELGDKSQLAIAALATRFQPLWVFGGTLAALLLLAALAIPSGRILARRIDPYTLSRISALTFILIGIGFLVVLEFR